MSHFTPYRFSLSFCGLLAILTVGSYINQVAGGGTRPLTLDEIMQIQSTGALSKYNTLDGRDDSDDTGSTSTSTAASVSNAGGSGRKARCFFSSPTEKTWVMNPRLQYEGPVPQQSPQYPPYYYTGYSPSPQL